MAASDENPNCSVYIGNLDEKVSERALYDILIEAGPLVDLHLPLDKQTAKHRGFAFAEFESEQVADYAVKLFSGLVKLNRKTLKFAVSGKSNSISSSSSSSDKSRQVVENNVSDIVNSVSHDSKKHRIDSKKRRISPAKPEISPYRSVSRDRRSSRLDRYSSLYSNSYYSPY